MSLFADPPNTTAETIAIYLDTLGEFEYLTPASVTAETLATDLDAAAMGEWLTPVSVTPEDIALALNASSHIAIAGPNTALRAWRAW